MSEQSVNSNVRRTSLDRLSQKLASVDLEQSRRDREGLKSLLLQELDDASDTAIEKTLDFLRFLNYDERERQQDLTDARTALEEAKHEGTISIGDIKQEFGL